MKPRGMSSRWAKVLPWYYVTGKPKSRRSERDEAIRFELSAEADDENGCGVGGAVKTGR